MNQPQPQSPAEPEQYSTASEPAAQIDAHLDNPDLDALVADDAELAAAVAALPDQPEGGFMPLRDFWPVFAFLCRTPNFLFLLTGQPPLDALNVDPRDPEAKEACKALYRRLCAVRVTWFLVSRKSSFYGDVATLGMFGFSLYSGAAEELRARRAKRVKDADPHAAPSMADAHGNYSFQQ